MKRCGAGRVSHQADRAHSGAGMMKGTQVNEDQSTVQGRLGVRDARLGGTCRRLACRGPRARLLVDGRLTGKAQRPRAAEFTAGCQRQQSHGSPPPSQGGSGPPQPAAASARRPAQPWTSCLQTGAGRAGAGAVSNGACTCISSVAKLSGFAAKGLGRVDCNDDSGMQGTEWAGHNPTASCI